MSVNKEDCLMWALGNVERGTPIEKVLKDAEAIRVWMDESGTARPEGAQVSEFTDVVAERDRARDLAVRLEQENAELQKNLQQMVMQSAKLQKDLLDAEQELSEVRTRLIKGILFDLRHKADRATFPVQQVFLLDAIRELSTRHKVSL